MEKICKNCENFSGERKIERFLGSPKVNVRYSKENICIKTRQCQANGNCSCNCNSFRTWNALQNEIDKIKAEKEKKLEMVREKQKSESLMQSRVSNHSYESRPVSDAKVKLTEVQIKQRIHEDYLRDFERIKKLKAVPIIFSVLGALMFVLGIVLKVLANKVAESNADSSSYYAKQNQSSAATASTLGIVLIIVSIVCIIVSWAVWFYKYSKAKKAVEEN